MDKGVTCEHLTKLADVLGKELWQTRDTLTCFDCGCPGPNLWICLQPDCHHIGCSEVKNDHSTIHQKNFPTHCVHMNVSTERIWCYVCEKEVHIRAALAQASLSPDSTSLEGQSMGAQFGSMTLSHSDDDLDPEDMDYDDENRPRGLVGLKNMGNTCYMNAALQALSNTAPLTSYFLECAAAVHLLCADKKPALSRAYQKLIKEMWSRKTRGYVLPNGILYGIRNVHPMFRGYHQHDTQEFLRCFMDQLHEELKEPVYDGTAEDKMGSEDGDHQDGRVLHVRRRAASSGASDAPLFARMRRKSPAPSSYSESRADGYLRVHGHETSTTSKHRRSASFAGTQQLAYTAVTNPVNGTAGPEPRPQDVGSESELSCSSEAEERYETCSSGASDIQETAPDRTHKPVSSGGGVGGGDGAGAGTRYRSVISDVFDGKLLSSVQCLICDRVSTRVETFQDLSLPIPSREHLAVIRCQQPPSTPPLAQDSWVSTRVETFQDLSLPIPSREHLAVIRCQQPPSTPPLAQDSWVWWLLSWLRSWFYGPVVSLQDCLAAFFSADELKGDNMYSCSRCNKLRNGVKTSGVIKLPEVLCVHLKRFRHELMFSAKVAARVSFPLKELDMAPYTHKECSSRISRYELCAVICHAGTAGGGHYTCVARNRGGWYVFDDTAVAPISHHQLAHTEAYVLFYKKVNPQMTVLRQKAAEILQSTNVEPNDIKFYISKQWINKFNTWAEPGPIDNSDFVCCHGGVRPDRARHLPLLAACVPQPLWEFLYSQFNTWAEPGPIDNSDFVCCHGGVRPDRARHLPLLAACVPQPLWEFLYSQFNTWAEPGPIDNSDFVCCHGGVRPDRARHLPLLAACVPQPLWEFLYEQFGGGPAVSHVHECGVCARAAQRLRARRARELAAFCDLHAIFQEQERPRAIYAISMHWFRQWQAFVRNKTPQPPPPVDNSHIVTTQEVDGKTVHTLKPGSDHAQLSEELWRFFTDIYGGGPDVRLRAPRTPPASSRPPRYSESDREDYCTKSNSDINIRDSLHNELQKNQSLQNINRRTYRKTESDEDAPYRAYKKQEPNGNYDSDEDMDVSPPQSYVNVVRMENGVDSSDHDANDNPVTDPDLPNLDSISLKSKWAKSGKPRKTKRRTVK